MEKSNLIKKLARGEMSTELALKQLKVILIDFPNEELLQWVNNELYGYDANSDLPRYRVTSGVLKGSFLCGYSNANNVTIPLDPNAPDELKHFCNTVEFYESISALSELKDNKDMKLIKPVPPDLIPFIMKHSLITMTALLEAKVEFGVTVVSNILSVVNNKVLDALLLLEQEFGNLDQLDIDISTCDKSKIESINKALTIIINDKSVNIGDNNSISKSTIEHS